LGDDWNDSDVLMILVTGFKDIFPCLPCWVSFGGPDGGYNHFVSFGWLALYPFDPVNCKCYAGEITLAHLADLS
jgi:hypothetical protein